MKEERIIKVMSLDKRYIRSHYKMIAPKRDDINTFLTGQHIDPYDPETNGNLSVEQMIGKEKLTEEQQKKFGKYIINPNDFVPIRSGMVLNITVKEDGTPLNARDYYIWKFLQYQVIVAKDKESYNKVHHRFYFEDKEYEASVRINKRDNMYKAIEKVRSNLSLEKLTNLAIMFNYYIKEFNVNPKKVSKIQLEDMVYEQCEKNPQLVLKCFDAGWEDRLYVLKLADDGIIQRKGDDFYDGAIYIGQGLEGVKIFMNKAENRPTINKWASLTKGVVIKEDNTSKHLELLSEGYQAILEGDKAKIAYVKEKLIELGANDILKKLLEQENKSQEKENGNTDEIPALLTLKQKAGRLKYPKEEWGEMSQEELFEYLKNKEQSN